MPVLSPGPHPAPQAEQSPLCPSAHGGWIRQACRILALRYSLLGGGAGGDAVAGLLPAVQAVVPGRRQPIGQDREGPVARMTDSAPHPNAFAPVIVGLPEAADDRVVPAYRTLPRQEIQWDHPGSLLSFASSSALKRITAGVKARR